MLFLIANLSCRYKLVIITLVNINVILMAFVLEITAGYKENFINDVLSRNCLNSLTVSSGSVIVNTS